MTDATFAPGSVIRNRDRLWRVDAQMEDAEDGPTAIAPD